MWSRKRQALLSCAVIVVAVAAGWWQLRDVVSDAERIASIDGVVSAEYNPGYWYYVTLEPGLSTERVRDVLAEISATVASAEDRDGLPMMRATVESAGPAEFSIDISDDFNQTAAIITATTTSNLADADVELTGLESSSQFGFKTRDEVLPGVRHFVSSLGRAGVDDLTPMGEDLEFYYTKNDTSELAIEFPASSTAAALHRLDILDRSLRLSGADLIRADDLGIEVAVPKGSPVDRARQAFTAAYGERHLDLTVTSQAR